VRRRKVRAARDAGVLADPRASASREAEAERCFSIKRRSDCRNRKSAISPASRARCLKPAPHDPRWTYLSGFRPHRRGSLSTASGASTCLDGWHRRYDMPPRAPGDARLARRDRAASAVSARVCVLHPSETTAPDPHSKTPLEAPLVDRGGCIIRQVLRAGITFFREVIPAMWERLRFPSPRAAGRGWHPSAARMTGEGQAHVIAD
jgi:hypothetical protein